MTVIGLPGLGVKFKKKQKQDNMGTMSSTGSGS